MKGISGLTYKDLVQEGWIALINLADRFDPDRDVKFSTFAYPRVEGRIKDLIRKEIKTDRAENSYDHNYFEGSIEKSANTQKEFEELSGQEQEVVTLYAEGYTQDEIGGEIDLTHGRISQILSDIKTRLTKSPPSYDNKLGKENGKTKSETPDDEKYAFSDFLHSDKAREEAEHDYQGKKPKPTYSTEYDPDKSKIDFVGVGWKEFLESKGIDMSKIYQDHYQALLWQSGYDRKNLNRPKKKNKWTSPVSKRVKVRSEENQQTEIYRLMKDSKDSNREENKISPDTSLGKTLARCNRLEEINIDNSKYKVIAMKDSE